MSVTRNGINGFENKKRSRLNIGRSLRNRAEGSQVERHKKKLLGKAK